MSKKANGASLMQILLLIVSIDCPQIIFIEMRNMIRITILIITGYNGYNLGYCRPNINSKDKMFLRICNAKMNVFREATLKFANALVSACIMVGL